MDLPRARADDDRVPEDGERAGDLALGHAAAPEGAAVGVEQEELTVVGGERDAVGAGARRARVPREGDAREADRSVGLVAPAGELRSLGGEGDDRAGGRPEDDELLLVEDERAAGDGSLLGGKQVV